jgi:hypothetical protein
MDKSYLTDLQLSRNAADPCRAHRDRACWRLEAQRLGSDWAGILRLQAEVIATWRSRHDPDYTRAAA